MTASTRRTVLSLYMRVFRIARTWQAQSGVTGDTETERKYILQEAQMLFRQNQQLTDQESLKKCIEECEARIEIGLHYRNPYPRARILANPAPLLRNRKENLDRSWTINCCRHILRNSEPNINFGTYLPPMGLATQKGRKLRTQQRLRKQAKPIYLQSHDET